MPLLLKGILGPEDARRAVDVGADAVIVSNHGGRQLDTVLSGADALPPIVEAVGDRLDVLVDGGIRRGWDVAKALALGADAVLVGRPVLWGLARGGQAGAEEVLRQLLAELDSTLALLGCPKRQRARPVVRQAGPVGTAANLNRQAARRCCSASATVCSMTRTTSSGSSAIGTCPQLGRSTCRAWGRRWRAVLDCE